MLPAGLKKYTALIRLLLLLAVTNGNCRLPTWGGNCGKPWGEIKEIRGGVRVKRWGEEYTPKKCSLIWGGLCCLTYGHASLNVFINANTFLQLQKLLERPDLSKQAGYRLHNRFLCPLTLMIVRSKSPSRIQNHQNVIILGPLAVFAKNFNKICL